MHRTAKVHNELGSLQIPVNAWFHSDRKDVTDRNLSGELLLLTALEIPTVPVQALHVVPVEEVKFLGV